jgi:rhomboid protease GluP
MSNIHGFNDSLNSKGVGIRNSNSISRNNNDSIIQPSLYKIKTVTSMIMIINISYYIIQLLAYYSYFEKHKNNWSCLLVSLGAFQAGKIKNHNQYFRFFSSIIMHNSIAHLGSNSISLFFLGYQTEHEVNNKIQYLLLYLISGLEGNFMSIAFNQLSISVGASGAIIGLCGNFVIFFLLNYRNMSQRRKYSFSFMFLILFMNLFSGLAEGGENINMASHIGGFLGGFAYSIILKFGNYQVRENNTLAKRMYYCSITFLFLLPLIATGIVAYKKILDVADYICRWN